MPLTEPTRLVLRKGWQPMDADAAAYISAVEAADTAAGQTGGLEEKTKIAIDNFVLGCKQDGIWDAIKASCILAGARTLQGALVPLVGAAPTSFNFVDGDYNRKTGLIGDGSTKYLDSGRNNNADPQNSKHLSVFITQVSGAQTWIGTFSTTGNTSWLTSGGIGGVNTANRINQSTTSSFSNVGQSTGFKGVSRFAASGLIARSSQANQLFSDASGSPESANINVFRAAGIYVTSLGRIAFYSIGESLDLALLDARVTDLINAFGAAIP